MAAEDEQPLDEVVWSSPETVQEMGFIHTNTVLPYFSRSPFFDPTSNNAVVMNQAVYNQNMLPLVQTRGAFEAHLRSMAGLEFVVAHDPSNNDTVREHSGIWVIRKQTRRKRPGQEDEVTPHSCYFVVGDRVYMAPSVGGILESRMLSTVSKLTQLLATASTLPLFNPAIGHTYYPPAVKAPAAAKDSTSTRAPSKEGTPLPDAGAGAAKGALDLSQPSAAGAATSPKKTAARNNLHLLQQSIQFTERYGTEYMDTTPLQGEPGTFVLKRATAAATAAKSAVGPAAAAAAAAAKASASASATPTPSSGIHRPNAPTMAPLQTDVGSNGGKRRSVGVDEEKSAGAASPVTPGGTKKRKKSRVAGLAGGKITPTSAV